MLKLRTIEEVRELAKKDEIIIVCMPVALAVVVSDGAKIFQCCMCGQDVFAAKTSQQLNTEAEIPIVCLTCATKVAGA